MIDDSPAQSPLYGPIQQQALFEHLGSIHQLLLLEHLRLATFIGSSCLNTCSQLHLLANPCLKTHGCLHHWQPLLEHIFVHFYSSVAPEWTLSLQPAIFISRPCLNNYGCLHSLAALAWSLMTSSLHLAVPTWRPMATSIHQQHLLELLCLPLLISIPCLNTYGQLHLLATPAWKPITVSIHWQPLLEHLSVVDLEVAPKGPYPLGVSVAERLIAWQPVAQLPNK